jgi:hypothetical protein
MRADTHDGPEQMLHLEAEYIVAALTFVDLIPPPYLRESAGGVLRPGREM